ncbi:MULTISPECIES: MFS transporter [unclassified Bacillus (in: firmicutes)]|uniref:MFS transporter n=1 Tax=unclassified Bacillus (in: firmicutes) TaxID=185979 RepID=UPI0008E931AC|nr:MULTISPECIES: MFS transporter [unclassified Bacillus (in: firmicutes)]SFA96053.1 MFS transporter, YQGE family, putative transporter [Bacillus sp. UNCCL13]SFQ79566.1 MFS transporter, YQGE family, putative transporter [Bacillus sp. cl95]
MLNIFKHEDGNVEASRNLSLLLMIGGLYSLSIALSNTFVNIYLWKQSGKFADIGMYNLAIVIMQPLTFILAGRWAKKVDRVIVLRMGVIFLTIFYLAVLFIGTRATDFILLLGGLLGIGYGFYWLAFNVLTFEITEPDTRDYFNGFLGILSSLGGMIGPMVAGFIISKYISYGGYSIVFGLSLCLFGLAVFLSFSLKRRPASGKYCFMRVMSERKNNPNWRYILHAHFFQGLREGTFLFVVSVFVFISTGSEFALGTFGLLNSGIAFVAYYFASRYIKPHNRKKAILTGGILLYGAVFLIVWKVTFFKLLLYAAVIAIAYPILLVPYMSMTYDVIGKGWNAAEMRIEYVVVKEIFLNAGRIASILSFLIAVTFFDEAKSIPVLLLILGAGHTCIYFFIRKVELSEG